MLKDQCFAQHLRWGVEEIWVWGGGGGVRDLLIYSVLFDIYFYAMIELL